jgi:hypothetical protein
MARNYRQAMGPAGALVGATLAVALGLSTVVASAARPAHAMAQPAGGPVQVSHDRYPAYAEPSLAVNPRNPRNLLAVAELIGRGPTVLGTFVSLNSGRTWRDNGPLPGIAGGDNARVAFDARGTGFVVAVVEEAGGAGGVAVWRTADGGRTFAPPLLLAGSASADYPGLAVAPQTGASPAPVYVVWKDDAGLAFSRSLDAGQTFSARRIISAPGTGAALPVIAAGPEGAIAVAYLTARSVTVLVPTVVTSANQGASFMHPTALTPPSIRLTPRPLPTSGLLSGLAVAIDPHDGTTYLAYAADRPGVAHAAIVLAHAHAGSTTWSTPLPVTPAPDTPPTAYLQPQVVVDDAGMVAISYFALAHGRLDLMLARVPVQGTGRQTLLRVTHQSFDPTLAPQTPGMKGTPWWIGDYQGLAAGPGALYPIWSDTRTGHLEIAMARIPTTVPH